MMKKRVGVIGLLHESNTFIQARTTRDHFRQDVLCVGQEVRDRFGDAPHEIGGFFHGLETAGIEAVPVFAARAIPYGPIASDALDDLLEQMLDEVGRAGPLNGILAAPHGATVSEKILDVDGHWLGLLRQRLGDAIPIIATIDPHANLSRAMVSATDALIAYRTNPHLDQRDRGVEAAELMAASLRTGRKPTQVAEMMPLAINIQSQNTSLPPLKPIYDFADRIRDRPGIASISVVLGFPYADVPEMGSSAIVVGNGDASKSECESLLNDLVARILQSKDQFEPEFIDAATAVQRAAAERGTTCLLDMGDNVGGGSPADGTILAGQLHEQRIGRSMVCLHDPQAVCVLRDVAVGQVTTLGIGGNTDGLHGDPLNTTVRVLGHYDGRFQESEPRHGGFTSFDQGETVVVETTDSQITIMLTSKRMPPFSLSQLTSFGMDPTSFRAIVAKGVIAPMAAYSGVVDRFIHVNTPGVTCADMKQLRYQHRRRPMFPFESR